jgi:hypothetical protein
MRRLGIGFAFTAALAVVIFFVLKARLGGDAAEGASEEDGDGGDAHGGKKKPKDFAKSKAGLVRVTDLEMGSKEDPDAPPIALGEYVAAREKALKAWRAAKVDLDWEGVPIEDAFAELAGKYDLHAQLDPEALGKSVTFRVEQLGALAVLDLLTKMCDLAWVVNGSGEVWIVPKDKVMSYAPPAWIDLGELWRARAAVLADRNSGVTREPELARKLRDTVVAARSVPAGDIYAFLNFLSQVTEINYVMRPTDTPPQLPALAAMEGETVDAFLRRVLEPVRYTFLVTEESVILLSKDADEEEKKQAAAREEERKARLEAEANFLKTPVMIGGEEMALRDLATELGRALDVPVAIDPRSWRRAARYSFKAIEQPAFEIVRILKKGAPLEVTLRDGKLWFLAPEDLHEGETMK